MFKRDDFSWNFWYTLPLYPYGRRRTLRREIVQDTLWTFEQVQGIFYVVVPIRMTVVRLEAGGLLVYAPVAPTTECVRLVQELVAQHGEVKYIILPTISGLEHKVFVGPFARKFPSAQIFVAPNQWSFPINLPLSWLGFPPDRTHILPKTPSQAPFAAEFDYALLGPIHLGPGTFAEVAFFHRRSRTLLVTDSVVSVPPAPPDVVQLDPYPLLFHARDDGSDEVADTPANRQKGWRRISLFAFYFRPSAVETIPLGRAWRDARKAKDRSRKAYFGLFPFKWKPGWEQSFAALQGNGRPFVAPVLQTLILNRAPQETVNWATQVSRWNFERIVPCHFDAPIAATPQQFQQMFSFLQSKSASPAPLSDESPLPPDDFELLKEIDTALSRSGLVPLAKEKI